MKRSWKVHWFFKSVEKKPSSDTLPNFLLLAPLPFSTILRRSWKWYFIFENISGRSSVGIWGVVDSKFVKRSKVCRLPSGEVLDVVMSRRWMLEFMIAVVDPQTFLASGVELVKTEVARQLETSYQQEERFWRSFYPSGSMKDRANSISVRQLIPNC